MADLLRFVVALATEPDVRERFQLDPAGVLSDEVDDADDLTGEDVEAATHAARQRVPAELAAQLRVDPPVRPVGAERPADAALRVLEGLGRALTTDDGPSAIEPVTEPRQPAPGPGGGGEPVPTEPPGFDGRRLWVVGDATAHDRPVDPDHPAAGGHPALHVVPEPEGGFRFSVLEVVQLPHGLPDAGIEPGARATVIAVLDDGYEIEVDDPDEGRRFLGVVPADQLSSLPR